MNIPLAHASAPSDEARLAARLAALSHPARIHIMRHLGGSEACCCKDVVEQFDLAQSTVSQHLRMLVEAGLVRLVRSGQRSLYMVDRGAMAALAAEMESLAACCRQPREAGPLSSSCGAPRA